MLLKILHTLGLTNLSDEQVELFEREREEQPQFPDRIFRRASACDALPYPLNLALCVEVAYKDGYIAIRNASDKKNTILIFSSEEWKAFVNGVKAGEFDFDEIE